MEEYQGPLLSAQSTVQEPPALWQQGMASHWQADAPRIDPGGDYGDQLLIKGATPRPLKLNGAFAELSRIGTALQPGEPFRYGDGHSPQFRLQQQIDQGLDGEVLYPTLGAFIFTSPDGDYQQAACAVYNDWIADFIRQDASRLKAMALLPARADMDALVAEAKRAAETGHSGVILPARNAVNAYNDPEWDELWGVLQESGLVCSFHLGAEEGAALAPVGPGAAGILLSTGKYELNEVLQMLVWGGAVMRFPKLQWGLVGSGTGWVATQINLMNHWWNDHKGWMQPRLEQSPVDYWLRQFHATFNEDGPGVATREITGTANQLWAAAPKSATSESYRAQVSRTLGHLPRDELAQLVHGNTRRLFGFAQV